ncbi:MAG: hypothetical protein DRR06_13035 [Gammaproteobacteria bacterium]|nr:MAG: hypothetical protein DRR06_13035 [Gammaproteobacteria bacterium]RLA53577.1 MAG: hypothetical protein DRR42_04455 [Gammaproteobacteria bacterium]
MSISIASDWEPSQYYQKTFITRLENSRNAFAGLSRHYPDTSETQPAGWADNIIDAGSINFSAI